MPTIKQITARLYNVPLKGVLRWGKAHELKHLEHVLIRVELSDGAVGFAEATPRPTIYGETQASVLHIIEHYLTPMVIGQSIDSFQSVAHLSEQLELIKGNNTAKGALDMALHHAVSQSQGQSLAEYLSVSRSKIPVSYIVSTGALDAVMEDVGATYKVGVRVFKIKIGKDIPQEIETIRQLMGQFEDARFYVDANQTLNADSAVDVLDELYDLGVIHCEEALPVHYIDARQKLHQATKMPLIADDSAFTYDDLKIQISYDTFDILNIKTPRTGFSQSSLMLNASCAENKSIMIGSQASSLFGCLYAATYSAMDGIDCANECSFFLKTDTDLSDAPQIVDGYLDIQDVQNSIDKMIKSFA